MIQQTTLEEEAEISAFVKRAADTFSINNTSTYGDIENGKYLAIRWGLFFGRGVMVIKIDQDFQPRNFVDVIKGDDAA